MTKKTRNTGMTSREIYETWINCGSSRVEAAKEIGCTQANVGYHVRKYQGEMASGVDAKAAPAPDFNENYLLGRHNRFVITSATNDTATEDAFIKSLRQYCRAKSAELVIIPVRYKNPTSQLEDAGEISWDSSLPIVDKNFQIAKSLWVMASIKVPATAENPLSGFDGMSKGNSLIIGHPQLQHVNLPVLHGRVPAALWTTGSVSENNYSHTKTGVKADFNHSHSALVVEIEDDESFYIRDLNFDGKGFYDFNEYFHSEGVVRVKSPAAAIVTGDTHVAFVDQEVVAATYTNADSICAVLKPKEIVFHDIFDCYSVSHHHEKNIFTKFAKHLSGMNCLRTELEQVRDFLKNVVPDGVRAVFADSNHPGHFKQFLTYHDPRHDMVNLEIYHAMMYLVLKDTRMSKSGASSPDPFRLYMEPLLKESGIDAKFLSSDDSYMIKDVEVSMHGHLGANGSRGNIRQFSKLPNKNISGHCHTAGINKGARQVGTSTLKRLEYNAGASNWTHTHCVIYENGTRQLITIVNGKWRLVD